MIEDNVDYLPNNIPQYIKNDDEQTDFIILRYDWTSL